MKKRLFVGCLLVTHLAVAQESSPPPKADAQFFMGILLDKIITVGSLKACPLKDNPNRYYYFPNKVRIATDEATGKPKFSFIKYVTNVRSKAEETELKQGVGGGWVHFLMGLKVTDEEIARAETELSRKVPGAKLIGPVIYRSGTVSLITKSAATNNEIKILGTEDAPVLDGDFIAVGFPLNAEDAAILWETMQSATPDVSLNFNMTIAGLNSPVGAKIEVNWDILNQHRIMNLAVDVPVVKAEISDMVTDLRQNGTIKVTTVGNQPLDAAVLAKIENSVIDLCFSKSLDSSRLARSGDNYLITNSADGTSRRQKELARKDALDTGKLGQIDGDLKEAKTEQAVAAGQEQAADTAVASAEQKEDDRKQEELKEELALANQDVTSTKDEQVAFQKKLDEAKDDTEKETARNELTEVTSRLTKAQERIQKLEKKQADFLKNRQVQEASKAKGKAEEARSKTNQATEKVTDLERRKEKIGGLSLADFSVEAVYHRAKIKRSGHFELDLNHYAPVTIDEPFGGNIGKINCRGCLMEVNTASHLYTQRELVAYLDGGVLSDFDKYINFVTVKMRKKHHDGDLTYDEVRIDRKNFNSTGNAFKMMYGWNRGDNDRRTWLDYDYQTTWNFFGGSTISQDWKPSNENVISLSAPFNRSEIKCIADEEKLRAASVRAVFIKIQYKLGEKSYVKRATIYPASAIYQQLVEVVHPKDDLTYSYEIDWDLTNNTTIKSGQKTTTSDILFVDVLPKTN